MQGQTIEGKVFDEEGKALISAQILTLPDSNSTITDVNGHFQIKVSTAPYQIKVFNLGIRRKRSRLKQFLKNPWKYN